MNKIEISSQSCFCLVTLEDITMSRYYDGLNNFLPGTQKIVHRLRGASQPASLHRQGLGVEKERERETDIKSRGYWLWHTEELNKCEPAWTSLRYQVSAAITCNTAQSNKIVRGSRMKVSISSLLLPIKVLFSQPLRSQTARLAS
ncbi:Protein of unknown function [Gryllus bimaculatus]|nr:Protein of unknown function [Gryllus bimaculatus]